MKLDKLGEVSVVNWPFFRLVRGKNSGLDFSSLEKMVVFLF